MSESEEVRREAVLLVEGIVLAGELDEMERAVGFIVVTSWMDDGKHHIGAPVGLFTTMSEADEYVAGFEPGLNKSLDGDDKFVVQVRPLLPPDN